MDLAGQTRPAFLLYHFLWEALDWIFPPTCGGCHVDGQRWCQSCQQKVSLMNGPICQRCGDKSDEEICPNCQQRPPAYIKLRSFASFEGTIRNALHRLKYKSDIGLGEALSKHLIELYNRER